MKIAGLDVGPKQDRTAFVVSERMYDPDAVVLRYRNEWEGKNSRLSAAQIDAKGKKRRVPIVDFDAVYLDIVAYFRKFSFQELVYDPYQASSLAQRLELAGVPVLECPQTVERLVPISNTFYQAVAHGMFKHPPDPDLDQQAKRVVAKQTERGWRISKEQSGPIDSMVAAAMTVWRLLEVTGVPDWAGMVSKIGTRESPVPAESLVSATFEGSGLGTFAEVWNRGGI